MLVEITIGFGNKADCVGKAKADAGAHKRSLEPVIVAPFNIKIGIIKSGNKMRADRVEIFRPLGAQPLNVLGSTTRNAGTG